MRAVAVATSLAVIGILSETAEASIPMMSCFGCTLQEEENRAMTVNGSGFLFVHNAEKARVRKFELYFDTKGERGLPDPKRPVAADGAEIAAYAITPDPNDDDRVLIGERIDSAYEGWRRVLVEYPVEPEVADIADAFAAAEKTLPQVNYPKDYGPYVPIQLEDLGVSRSTSTNFDPREIAWSANQNGASTEFAERLMQMTGTREEADRLSPVLGSLLYDIWDAAKRVKIRAGSTIETGLAIYDTTALVRLEICDRNKQCVYAKIDRTLDPGKVELTSVADRYGKALGAGNAPFDITWESWRGADAGAREYADWLRKTKNIPVEVVSHPNEEQLHQLICVTQQGKLPLRCRMYTP